MIASAPARRVPSAARDGNVIIVGGGLAGLFCALRLAPRPVTVLAAAPIGEGASSAWAQGGLAAAISEGDSIEAHLADTIAVGGGIVDADIARGMIAEAADRVADLLALGVPFDRDLDGHLVASREAAHSRHRVIHVRGDMAGRAIMEALIAAVRQTPSIRLVEGYIGEAIVTAGVRAVGVEARPRAGGARLRFPADAVVLATGGAGHLFAVTTNPVEATAAGIGMAARAGAMIADAEFVQFHPTAIDVGRDPAPLATEVLRGEGATLIDQDGRRFLIDIDARGELAPRDIVARAIHRVRAGGGKVFLDCRAAVGAGFPERFPTVYRHCTSAGIDPVRDLIPVAPAAHYHMGGVLTGADGRSSLPGLWACGETASTGAHGANRLASNSLLEAVVFAARIADDIKGTVPEDSQARVNADPNAAAAAPPEDDAVVGRLRRIMSDHVGVERDRDGLVTALAAIAELTGINRSERVGNMLGAARVVAAAALLRTESRGAHFRSDFPETDASWQRRSLLTLAEAERVVAAPGAVGAA